MLHTEYTMDDYAAIYQRIIDNDEYKKNIDYGEPRSGHPEGSVRAHIAELEDNLQLLKPSVSDIEYWKLKILIHVHDTFKGDAKKRVSIEHPESHASLAVRFLDYIMVTYIYQNALIKDRDLLAMAQYHDIPYAIWKRYQDGKMVSKHILEFIPKIKDWNLFFAFLIIDGCTAGKVGKASQLIWFRTMIIDLISHDQKLRWKAAEIDKMELLASQRTPANYS